ncbi:sterol delta-7 reductase, partial [Striga asiatica]
YFCFDFLTVTHWPSLRRKAKTTTKNKNGIRLEYGALAHYHIRLNGVPSLSLPTFCYSLINCLMLDLCNQHLRTAFLLKWYTMVHADGSVLQTWDYLRQNGLHGFINIWPKPSPTAWKIIACYGAFEAALQLWLPGKRVEGPISPNGNRPVYKGMELYPRIGKNFDIKVFTNCRFGMMSWAVLAVTYCIKQYETYGKVSDSMLVNTILILVYVTKFFWWESGYWNTMDIAHDRAGFYICWGCLVWVPSVYTSPGMYLVNHPVNLGLQLALYILVAGIVCIYINYDCDRQRQEFRRTNGKCLVWGKAPSKIVASYTTTTGETKTSLLLTSGWWGLARHFHYVPEIMGAFFWTVPALFNHFLPYFYVVFLTILLFDRAKRDDDRCKSKYGKYWKLYCEKVPYKVIPGIY